jgi:hypothetical protein
MSGLEIFGLVALIIDGMLVPRFVASIVIGCFMTGAWWWLFLPLCLIGLALDIGALVATFDK